MIKDTISNSNQSNIKNNQKGFNVKAKSYSSVDNVCGNGSVGGDVYSAKTGTSDTNDSTKKATNKNKKTKTNKKQANNSQLVVSLKDVSKYYSNSSKQKVCAVQDINIEINQEDRVVVTGASGSGKSTLLHLIGTLDKPSSGQIVIDGRDVTKLSDFGISTFRNTHVGFVFQMNNLLSEFSAIENVVMPGLISGIAKKTVYERAVFLMDAVGLTERKTHRPHQLSGGEQQRVAIARALLMNPRLLLADEPTGNLDRQTSIKIKQLLFSVCDLAKTTMILITHDSFLAAEFKKKIIMEDGKIATKVGF